MRMIPTLTARAILFLLPLLFQNLPAKGGDAQRIPKSALKHADDYTFGFYPKGWREGKKGSIEYAIQTNRYGLLMDASKARAIYLGPLANALPEEQAATQPSSLIHSLPRAEVTFQVHSDGRSFVLSSGAGSPEQMRLCHVGKYLQHFEVETTQIGGAAYGSGLEGIKAWLEGYCWSDRISFLLHAARYDTHLAPALKLERVQLSASLKIPNEYPLLKCLDDSFNWKDITASSGNSIAMACLNEKGEGIAVIAIPGCSQTLALGDGEIILQSSPFSMDEKGSSTFACLILPSSKVLEDALKESRSLSPEKQGLQVQAKGLFPYETDLETGYDPLRGWTQVWLGENADPNKNEWIRLRIRNPSSEPATIRLNFAKAKGGYSITGMSPVLCDGDGYPSGLPVQISKNWHISPAWFHGIAMLEAPPETSLEMQFMLAYADWAGAPAVSHAQLCLVGYGGNQLWDEMAIGSNGESICYDPDVNLNRSMIDDMRPLMVWAMGKEPFRKWSWTHNIGGSDFLTLFKKGSDTRQYLRRMKTLYLEQCPLLSDVVYVGETPDGGIQASMRAQTWRSDDYVRALYSLRYQVVCDVDDFDRLAFFQLGADHYNMSQFLKIARGSASGMEEAWTPELGGRVYSRRGVELPGDQPWIALYENQKIPAAMYPEDKGAIGDKGLIVRAWKARLDGADVPSPHYSVYGSVDRGSVGMKDYPEGFPTVLVELSPPEAVKKLRAGDFVETQVETVLLPQTAEDYYGPNQAFSAFLEGHPNSWTALHREASLGHPEMELVEGVLEREYPLRIQAREGKRAEFYLKGGLGYVPLTISGAASPYGFELASIDDQGARHIFVPFGVHSEPSWQTLYCPESQTFDLTFSLPLDSPDDQTVRRHFIWEAREP